VAAALVVVIDLTTKAWARSSLTDHDVHVLGPMNLHLSYNRGFAFSMLSGSPWLAGLCSLIALTAVGAMAVFARPVVPAVGLGLIFGGGVSNLVDRVTSSSHEVTDFIAVGSFPVFNLADAAVTVGVVLVIVVSLTGGTILARS
jgi:signal peptidase II